MTGVDKPGHRPRFWKAPATSCTDCGVPLPEPRAGGPYTLGNERVAPAGPSVATYSSSVGLSGINVVDEDSVMRESDVKSRERARSLMERACVSWSRSLASSSESDPRFATSSLCRERWW
jgi:hypothetical protein